jgi:DNA-binding NtrC family response regulator
LSSYKEAKHEVVESFTWQYLKKMLRHTGGNVSEAARISGIGRVSLQKILRRIGMDADEFRR